MSWSLTTSQKAFFLFLQGINLQKPLFFLLSVDLTSLYGGPFIPEVYLIITFLMILSNLIPNPFRV